MKKYAIVMFVVFIGMLASCGGGSSSSSGGYSGNGDWELIGITCSVAKKQSAATLKIYTDAACGGRGQSTGNFKCGTYYGMSMALAQCK